MSQEEIKPVIKPVWICKAEILYRISRKQRVPYQRVNGH